MKKIEKSPKLARLRSRTRMTGVDADTRPQPRTFVEILVILSIFFGKKIHRLRKNQEIERTPLRSAAHLLVGRANACCTPERQILTIHFDKRKVGAGLDVRRFLEKADDKTGSRQ